MGISACMAGVLIQAVRLHRAAELRVRDGSGM